VGAELDGGFEAWARGAEPRLLRAAFLLTGDRQLAQDRVQDALIRTYVRWARVGNDNPEGYARRAVFTSHVDAWRVARRSVSAGSGDDLGQPPAEGHERSVVDRDELRLALLRLTERERAVVVLRYLYDLTEQQAARELGLAVGTVKSAHARAIGKLHALLRPDPACLEGEPR